MQYKELIWLNNPTTKRNERMNEEIRARAYKQLQVANDIMNSNTVPVYSSLSDDRLLFLKRHFSELAMRACPLHLALRYKREISQSSSVDGLRKIGVRLVEEICQ